MPSAIEVTDLVVRYGPVTAVDGLTIGSEAGEVLALLGPNGAGKTTTVETLEGYRRPTAGRVRVLGLDPVADRTELTPKIGVMLQRGGVYPAMSSRQALQLFAAYYDDPEDPDALVERMALRDVERTPWRRLSGGEQQRVLIARALAGQPDLFFLDEPTAGVDLPNQQALAEALGTLKSRGSTIVLVAHELGAMAPLVDRSVVMRDGRVAYDGEPLADHEVHHPDFGEAHTHHHGEPGGRDHSPHVGSPLDRG